MSSTFTSSKHFPLGRIVITANAARALHPADVQEAMLRHAFGDWGEVGRADWAENELALQEGERLFSVYRDRAQQRFYLITEADRSVTTCLLPEDY